MESHIPLLLTCHQPQHRRMTTGSREFALECRVGPGESVDRSSDSQLPWRVSVENAGTCNLHPPLDSPSPVPHPQSGCHHQSFPFPPSSPFLSLLPPPPRLNLPQLWLLRPHWPSSHRPRPVLSPSPPRLQDPKHRKKRQQKPCQAETPCRQLP